MTVATIWTFQRFLNISFVSVAYAFLYFHHYKSFTLEKTVKGLVPCQVKIIEQEIFFEFIGFSVSC